MTARPSPKGPGAEDPRPSPGDPLSHLLGVVLADVTRLVRGEIALARAEFRAALMRAAVGLALLCAAVAVGIAALVVLAQAAALGLHAAGLPPWAATLVAGAVMLLLAVVCGYIGLRRLSPAALIPGRALRNLRRDGETLYRKADDDARSRE